MYELLPSLVCVSCALVWILMSWNWVRITHAAGPTDNLRDQVTREQAYNANPVTVNPPSSPTQPGLDLIYLLGTEYAVFHYRTLPLRADRR